MKVRSTNQKGYDGGEVGGVKKKIKITQFKNMDSFGEAKVDNGSWVGAPESRRVKSRAKSVTLSCWMFVCNRDNVGMLTRHGKRFKKGGIKDKRESD